MYVPLAIHFLEYSLQYSHRKHSCLSEFMNRSVVLMIKEKGTLGEEKMRKYWHSVGGSIYLLQSHNIFPLMNGSYTVYGRFGYSAMFLITQCMDKCSLE
ncbi:hypothetical protein MAR_021455 [Mya arenaria]|uniref:Uncharacterized protein n=1 Tax=Mya arenaria TaxID=6604 RepID=A0ABY7EG13_MYAAR|nr:hypothetical protein MAR_021455 [Mya arenaria]